MFLEIFCFLILTLPLVYALWDDRKGDRHPNRDLEFITIIGVVSSLAVAVMNHDWMNGNAWDLFVLGFRAGALAAALYISLFPYLIVAWLVHKKITVGKWYDHLSPTAVPDKWPIWKNYPWPLRMIILAGVLVGACFIYF